MVVHWYRQNLGTKYEVSPMPWLYQDYVGHDNNRDGYMMNMKEEQVVIKTAAGIQPGDLLLPASDRALSGAHLDSAFLRSDLEQHQPLCAQLAQRHRRQHDGLPECARHARRHLRVALRQLVCRLYRLGARLPQRDFVLHRDGALSSMRRRISTPSEDFPKNYQDLRALTMYSTPWEGGWWHLKDAVDYMVGGSMSVLDLAAKNRETLLYNRYQAARDNISTSARSRPSPTSSATSRRTRRRPACWRRR